MKKIIHSFSILLISSFFLIGCSEKPQQDNTKNRSFFCQETTSCIIEAPEYFSELKDIASKHDLILLDMDYVVVKPGNYKCEKAFLRKMFDEQGSGNWPAIVENNLFRKYLVSCAKKEKYKPIPVSKKLIADFSEVPSKNVFGLTARRIKYLENTLNDIQEVGMRFSNTKNLKESDFIGGGVIFVGRNDKGEVLQDLISKGYFGDIKSVFFIDDHVKNLEAVAKSLDKNIVFTGIHYTEGNFNEKSLADFTEDELDKQVKKELGDLINI